MVTDEVNQLEREAIYILCEAMNQDQRKIEWEENRLLMNSKAMHQVGSSKR